jgi:hypothetical protein
MSVMNRDVLFPAAAQPPTANWPPRPAHFPELMLPVEAAQYLRLDELPQHSPASATRTLNYWRDQGQLRATKYARHVWYRKVELDRFLEAKTER